MANTVRFLLLSVFLLCFCASAKHHQNNNRLMELLTAGIVAKVLQKQEDQEGGHDFYPLPIHVPMHHSMHGSESQRHHHHVTEKIIPIPIPHHTTRIIHINAAGASHDNEGGGSGHYDSHEHDDDRNSGSSPSIQQLFFQDSGVYGQPMTPPVTQFRPTSAYMAFRRPTMGMMPAAAAHPAYIVRGRYPYVAMRHRMPSPTQYGPPLYTMPYRGVPAAATFVNPMVMRRPATTWYG